ncbi:hypothetical protein GCM10010182_00730 [Actinomadura cremea]|nr:hypothetical protein GCM10010182_00730 [Actinomadura cremea]
MTARAAADPAAFTARTRGRLFRAPVAHFDETALLVTGRLHLGALGFHRRVHPDHGARQARPRAGAAGVLPHFIGVAVHDGWAPYDTYTRPPTLAATPTCCANCGPSSTITTPAAV